MTTNRIDKVQRWLSYLGVASENLIRQSDEELLVVRVFGNGDQYKLYIWIDPDGSIAFQSLAFKAAFGNVRGEINFYQSLLMYNGFLDLVSFGMSELEIKNEWGVFLNHVTYYRRLSAGYVKDIVDSFDTAYADFVPMLKKEAEDMGLKLSGQRRLLTNKALIEDLENLE